MNTPADAATTLVVKRFIKAPRERVFAAWTTPDDLLKWFGPKTCRVLSAQTDARVGGSYHLRVSSEACGELDLRGVYQEVKVPSRLVFTWNWSGNPAAEIGESVVTVNFIEADGGTDVHLIHERLPNAPARDNHSHGWNGCFDKLDLHFGGEDDEPKFAVGEVCWNELYALNTAAAGAFYSKLLGWATAAMPMGGMDYTLFKANGSDVGGMMAVPAPGRPAHWVPYVNVLSVDATAKSAVDLGAKICAGPFDVPNVGRIAVLQDPEGAAFGLHSRPSKE
jgi:uncharacterized protein YndB with AHSA1/START domain/predicted enzyme related to lactoylglutathione lyase